MNTRSRAIAAAALALVLCSGATAQHALDNNLSTRGRTNATRRPVGVSKDVYTLDRTTGSFRHNRANAFNDSTYSIFQSHTSDRFNSATPAGVSTAATAAVPSGRSASRSYQSNYSAGRRSALGTPARAPSRSPTRNWSSSSSTNRYTTGAAAVTPIAPAYHPATYAGTSRDVPTDAPPVHLSDRRGEWAPPVREDPDATVEHRGYSVVDDSIWPWR